MKWYSKFSDFFTNCFTATFLKNHTFALFDWVKLIIYIEELYIYVGNKEWNKRSICRNISFPNEGELDCAVHFLSIIVIFDSTKSVEESWLLCIYRVVQIKVYDRVCSLNQLIYWFFYVVFFFSLYIQTFLFLQTCF